MANMLDNVIILTLLLLLVSTIATSTSFEGHEPVYQLRDDVPHANHIFNAIHSSMRQWGSSWNHNGMSFFLATVPANTELYLGLHHGSGPVKGTNWLAFEPEHSLFFAGTSFSPPGPRPPPYPPRHHKADREDKRAIHNAQRPLHPPGNHDHGPPFPLPDFPHGKWEPGYLHTYRTKHALSMLYIDGLSAAKTDIGTLDTQDYLLLNWTSPSQPHGPEQENSRAKELCDMAKYNWNSKIDGIIRMELGFEIILCDFEKHVDLVNVVRPLTSKEVSLGQYMSDNQFFWYRGIAARFDGIGYDRVTLNYDDFITAFDFPFDIFPNGTTSPPRLNTLDIATLTTLRNQVSDLIHRNPLPFSPSSPEESTNWQSIADELVTRYASALTHFTTITNFTTLQYQIAMLMRPFIDFTNRNTTTELSRCTNHFLPPTSSHPETTARKAITTISHRICTVLLSTLSLSPSTSPKIYQTALKNLTVYLDWTTWRRCSTLCPYDEVCFIPIWPLGTVEDRKYGKGRCVNETGMWRKEGRSYWGVPDWGWGPPPGSGGPGWGGPMPAPIPGDGDGDGDGDGGDPELGYGGWSSEI